MRSDENWPATSGQMSRKGSQQTRIEALPTLCGTFSRSPSSWLVCFPYCKPASLSNCCTQSAGHLYACQISLPPKWILFSAPKWPDKKLQSQHEEAHLRERKMALTLINWNFQSSKRAADCCSLLLRPLSIHGARYSGACKESNALGSLPALSRRQ